MSHSIKHGATRILNFFQTSKIIFYTCSLIAFVLALISFNIWHQVFTEPNLPVQFKMAAPGVEYVRVYWDNPVTNPNAYSRVLVNPSISQDWEVKVEALAEKNPQAISTEVWILDISTPERQVDWSRAVMGEEKWELRDDPGGPQGKFAIAHSGKPQVLTVPIKGSDLTIKLLRYPGSGKARVTVNNQGREVREVDLFEAKNRAEVLTFPFRPVKGDEIIRDYKTNGIDTPWRRLKFVAEGGGEVKVEQVKVRHQVISAQENGEFTLPFRFWNRLTCTVASTVISFLWMTILFISTVHLWQREPDKRFGFKTYIIFLSIALGGFWMLVFYPASMSYDSVYSWTQALLDKYDDVNPPIMALLMRLVVSLVGNNIAYYTLLQATFFYCSIFFLIQALFLNSENQLKARAFLLACSLMAIYPVGWIYSVTLWKDVLLAIFCCFLAAFLIKYYRNPANFKSLIFTSIFLGLSVAARHSSVLIFIGVIILLLSSRKFWSAFNKYQVKKKLLALFLIFSSLLYSPTINFVFKVNHVDYHTFILYAQLIEYANSYYQKTGVVDERSLQYIDRFYGEGSTKHIFTKNFSCGTAWSYPQDKRFTAKTNDILYEQAPEIPSSVKREIINFFFRHPVVVIQHHLCVLNKLVNFYGVSNTYWYNLAINKNDIGLVEQPKLVAIRQQMPMILTGTFQWILSRHWIFLLVLVIAAVSVRAKVLIPHSEARLIFPFIGISYFLSYCLVPAAFDWRLLLSTTLLSVILIVSIISSYIVDFLWSTKAASPKTFSRIQN
jgi:hypothetical protein